MAEHNTLSDPNLHEPKGASTASAGHTIQADGAGNTSWSPLLENTTIDYAHIYSRISDGETLATIGTTGIIFPFSTDGVENGCVADAANNRITVDVDGIYEVTFSASIGTVAAGDAGDYVFTVQVDGIDSIIEAEVELSGTADATNIDTTGLLALSASDVITVFATSDEAGDTDDLNIFNASLVVKLIRAT